MADDPVRGAEADPDDDLIEDDDPDDGDDGRCPDCGADFTEEHELDCGYEDDDEPEDDEDEDIEDFA